MKFRSKYNHIVHYLLMIGFFAYPIMIRKLILPDIISPFNFFYLAIEMLTIIFYGLKFKKRKLWIVLVIEVLSIAQIVSNIKSHSVIFTICAYITIVLPLVMFMLDDYVVITYKQARKLLMFFNIIIILITLTGLLNVISDGWGASTFWLFLSKNDNSTRLWSIYGHPLFNTYLLLLFYIFNYYNNKYGKKLINNVLCLLISLIGVLFTASRTGIVLLFFLFLVSNYKSLKMTIVEILAFLIAYFGGLYELLIERFTTISFTNGRIDTYLYLMKQSYFVPYKIFDGYGTGYAFNIYSNYLSWASSAFEFPFLCYLLEYGYVFTILYYFLSLCYPCYILVKKRQWHLLACLLVIELDMNTFNGITLANDYQFVYIMTIISILAISKGIDRRGV